MKQLTKELKSVLTTWYNIDHRKRCDTQYRINYWYLTNENDIACKIYDGDNLLVKIKYGDLKDNNNFIRYIDDKKTKNLIKRIYRKYA